MQRFGTLLAQARRPRARHSDYWSTRTVGPLTPDNFGDFDSRNKNNLFWKYFYINHATPEAFGDDGRLKDIFHKVRPVIDELNRTFWHNYILEQEVVVDESVCAYEGKYCRCRMYMPLKPDKFGILTYKVCNKLGYTKNSGLMVVVGQCTLKKRIPLSQQKDIFPLQQCVQL